MWPKMWHVDLSIFFWGGGAICFSERLLSMSNPKQHWICENHPKSPQIFPFWMIQWPWRFTPPKTLQIFTLHEKNGDNEPRSVKGLLKESKIKSLATSYKMFKPKKNKNIGISPTFSVYSLGYLSLKKGKKVKNHGRPQLVAFKETTSWTSATSTPWEGKMVGPPTPHKLEIRPNWGLVKHCFPPNWAIFQCQKVGKKLGFMQSKYVIKKVKTVIVLVHDSWVAKRTSMKI